MRSFALRLRGGPAALFYGWWIALGGSAVEFIVGAVFIHAYGAYVVVIRDELGWSVTILSLGFALVRVEAGLLGPLQGWLVDRHGPRKVVSAGTVLLALGLLLFSRTSDLAMFAGAMLTMAVGASLAGFASLNVAVINWFRRRRATALSIAGIGNFASPLVVPLIALGFATFGWRTTATLSAVAVITLALPIAQILRHRPEPYGLLPDGAPDRDGAASASEAAVGLSPRSALRARSFWYLSIAHGCALFTVNAVIVHFIPHLIVALRITLAEASVFAAILSAFTVTGTLVGGVLADRLDRRDLAVACMGGHVLALVLLAFASAPWMAVGFAALHGLAWGIRGPIMSSLRADYFGRARYGTISGMSALIVTVGAVGGPLAAGISLDVTGSYATGFLAIAAFAAIGAAFFVLAARAAAVDQA